MYAILGLSGFACSGKDTTALLIEKALAERGYIFSRYAFADPIYNFAREVFEVGEEETSDRTKKETPRVRSYDLEDIRIKAINETINLLIKYCDRSGTSPGDMESMIGANLDMESDKDVIEALVDKLLHDILEPYKYKPNLFVRMVMRVVGKDIIQYNISPRKIVQLIGTEFFRNHVNKRFWTAIAPTQETIFTDVRFPEEVDFIHDNDGAIALVINDKIVQISGSNHESEQHIARISPDYIIINDGKSMEALSIAVDSFVDGIVAKDKEYDVFGSPVDGYGVVPHVEEIGGEKND